MSERVPRASAARASRMVEAAGIEPASEKVRTTASTRLADSFFYLTTGPLNGKWIGGQPKIFARQLWASLPGYPEFSAPRRIASGGLSGRRHSLSCECVVVSADYCGST